MFKLLILRVELKMVSRFLPRGLAGILYWYALLPTHRWLFEGMLRAGAAGYIVKESIPEELLEGIKAVSKGK